MYNYKSRKIYEVFFQTKGHFDLIILELENHYYGIFWYYEENKNRLDNFTDPAFIMKTQSFADSSFDELYTNSIAWIGSNIGNNYEISEA